MSQSEPDPQAIAEASAAEMGALNNAARSLGIVVEHVAPGYARLSMRVVASMLNGHGVVHGGFIFALADDAFGYACNSHGDRYVALSATITYVAPGREGETLIATAQERARGGRTSTYDIEVTSSEGKTMALFRGTSYRVGGTNLPPAKG